MYRLSLLVFTIIILSGILFSGCYRKTPSWSDKDAAYRIPSSGNSPVEIAIIHTGFNTSPKAFIYQGGSLFKQHRSEHVAFYIRHPHGDFLFESGLGENIDKEFIEMSWFERKIFSYRKLKTAKAQLMEHGIAPETIKKIVLSHLHWDHAGGIKDFPDARVVTSKEEIDFAIGEEAKSPAFLKTQYLDRIANFDTIKFNNKSYACFNASYDFYGDGSVVAVKLPGHTPGSIGLFVQLKSGKKLFLVGDTVWAEDQIQALSPKNRLAQGYVDHNKEKLQDAIQLLHKIKRANPDLIIVPSHDNGVLSRIKSFPDFE